MDDDILEQYRLEAAAAMEVEAKRRIAETTDVEQDENLGIHPLMMLKKWYLLCLLD